MKKIMFNDKYGLTQAVLEGRKTQTRRIATRQQLLTILWMLKYADYNMDELVEACTDNGALQKFAPYHIGEEIAIAQSYQTIYDMSDDTNFKYMHKACLDKEKGWANKMFVKAVLMPHRIKITNVRVERLQDISDEDCLKEGVDEDKLYSFGKLNEELFFDTPRKAYAALIEKVSGKGVWESNPYVFVYDFELIK